MSKFAKAAKTAAPVGVTATAKETHTYTHEGAVAFVEDLRTEFFSLAVGNFVSEDTFYENGKVRDARFVHLIEQLCLDPQHCDWLAECIIWLRNDANMRTASVVAAVEYARNWHSDAQRSGRTVIRETLTRADEPAEALAYWLSTYGKPIPYAIKRGIGDAAVKLYKQYSVNKYDSSGASVRMGDVIELCRPKPQDEAQADLFRYVIESRHNRAELTLTENLAELAELRAWHKNPDLNSLPVLATWETYSSHTKMDATAWENVIPLMGYMARLRNLRNFAEQGVSPQVCDQVANYLADPVKVANSRQLPFRFYSAYKHAPTQFSWPLEKAMRESVNNIPRFDGKTLILVDTSASMRSSYNRKSTVSPVVAATLFGSAVASRSDDADLWIYASSAKRHPIHNNDILKNVSLIEGAVGSVGHGTDTWRSLELALRGGDMPNRIFIFTDMQDHPGNPSVDKMVPKDVPVHVWDLGGYGKANIELGSNRYLHAGLSDQSFKTVALLENLKPGRWPWEIQN